VLWFKTNQAFGLELSASGFVKSYAATGRPGALAQPGIKDRPAEIQDRFAPWLTPVLIQSIIAEIARVVQAERQAVRRCAWLRKLSPCRHNPTAYSLNTQTT